MTATPRTDLLGLPLPELQEVLEPLVDRPFRSRQIYDAIYREGRREIDAISTLPKSLREHLADRVTIGWPEVQQQEASPDGTVKLVYRLGDGANVETVDIPEGRRRTFCVSSQVGCALGCRFCVTGFWGAGRNLTAGEILSQVLDRTGPLARAEDRVNVVFMGMGEPLLNLENVRRVIEILLDQISWRRVTLSTAGVVPAIREVAGWKRRPRLAISLHAPDDERRSEIMPINRSHPLDELFAALRDYPLVSGDRLTFEYLMLDGFNDSRDDADALARRLQGVRAKVNLIPLNPDPVLDAHLRPSPTDRVDAFRARLLERDVPCTVRRERGARVRAACGQLRVQDRDPRGFRGRSPRLTQIPPGDRQIAE